jgi:transcriptional regulator of aromatic amino acid metabolism
MSSFNFKCLQDRNGNLLLSSRRTTGPKPLSWRTASLQPPLRERERREDILLLVRQFLQKFANRHGWAIHKSPGEVMANLSREHYNWPGSVRELENIVERGIIMTTGLF